MVNNKEEKIMAQDKVRFVRIRGRVVPIGGSGRKSGKKPKFTKTEIKSNRRVAMFGAASFFGGFGAYLASNKKFSDSLVEAKRARSAAAAAISTSKSNPLRKELGKRAVSLAKKSIASNISKVKLRRASLVGFSGYVLSLGVLNSRRKNKK